MASMTAGQKKMLLGLVVLVVGLFAVLFYLIGRDLVLFQSEPLINGIQAAQAARSAPTVVWVWPTATPTPSVKPTITTEDALAFVKGFKYKPDQECNLATLLGTLETAGGKLGNKVTTEGWSAEAQADGRWLVTYTYWENTALQQYQFWVDFATRKVQGANENGATVLAFLKQQTDNYQIVPTPTLVSVPLGWAVRDYFTHWQYSVPEAPKSLKAIPGGGQPREEYGYLAVPLRLQNIADAPQALGPEYYTRFALRDKDNRLVGRATEASLLRPTRLYCRGTHIAEFTDKRLYMERDAVLDTQLVFGLFRGASPPFTLEITVYEGAMPHRYALALSNY